MRFQSTLFVLLCSLSLTAQYYEVGAFIGAANYTGELNNNAGLFPAEYNPAIGIFTRYNFSRNFSAKVGLTKGQISGDDSNSNDTRIRARNLSFRADIVEIAAQAEFNLLPYAIREDKISAPYLFLGVGGYYFNPQAQMRGNWYDLQPLGTEGQGNTLLSDQPKYSKYQVSFPIGLGFKFNLNHKVNIGFEVGARRTFNDYLDDVSGKYPDLAVLRKDAPVAAALSFRTPELEGSPLPNPVGQLRGNPDDQDWFFFMGMTISVNMTDKYGLDFDEKYDIFKSEETNEWAIKFKNKKSKIRKKKKSE